MNFTKNNILSLLKLSLVLSKKAAKSVLASPEYSSYYEEDKNIHNLYYLMCNNIQVVEGDELTISNSSPNNTEINLCLPRDLDNLSLSSLYKVLYNYTDSINLAKISRSQIIDLNFLKNQNVNSPDILSLIFVLESINSINLKQDKLSQQDIDKLSVTNHCPIYISFLVLNSVFGMDNMFKFNLDEILPIAEKICQEFSAV